MTAQLIIENKPVTERQFILPGRHDWQQLKAIQTAMENVPGLKISYLDGVVEFMTIGERHETLKTIICLLLGLYFLEKNIEFTPVGSATRENETKEVSFEPDESYYLGEKKAHPDLAIEVALTSGGKAKLKNISALALQKFCFGKITSFRFIIFEVKNTNEFPAANY